MMETPNAILNAGSIASVAADPNSRLSVMVMGLNDLAKETRARLTPGRLSMTAWLSTCVVAARAHGVDIIDGVYNDIKDLDGFRLECLQGRDMGLDGKTLIHPTQIDICNEIFAPTSAEVESAAAVIEAFALPENAGKGVIQLNGRMVELLHADMARRTLAIADAIAERSMAAE
jgi:citrate lyase subunit beta/citryl-CoA lyase